MTKKLIYAKAFAKALSEHLRGQKYQFTDERQGPGGCETCGFGAEEFDVLDMDALEKEIDKFAESFKKSQS